MFGGVLDVENLEAYLAKLEEVKGVSPSDLGFTPEFLEALGMYNETFNTDNEMTDKERIDERAEALRIMNEALLAGADAWTKYAVSMASANSENVTGEKGAGLLRGLADAGDIDGIINKFNQLNETERNWLVTNSKAFKDIMKNGKATKKDLEDLRREAAELDFKELKDSGKVWSEIGDLIKKDGKQGKEFAKTYGQAIDRVDDLRKAKDALAYIQQGEGQNTKVLEQAYKDLASYTGISADELRNNLDPAIMAITSESAICGDTISALCGWLMTTSGVTFTSSNWTSELAALAASADATTAGVANLVQQMLKCAGASLSIGPDGVVRVNWPNGQPSSYANSNKKKTGGGGGGGGNRGGGGGSSNTKTISEIERMVDLMSKIEEIFQFHQSMIQQIQSIYSDLGEYTNLIHVYQEEYDAIKGNNEVLKENVKRLEELLPSQQALVQSMSTSDEAYEDAADDLDKLQKAHQTYTKQLLENEQALNNLEKEMKEARKTIRDMEIDLENEILEAIEDRENRIKDMRDGRIEMEEIILDTLISMYEKERDAILDTANIKKEALQNELNLLDETLAKRKEASEQADKERELAEKEAKLAKISADPTRRAEQLKLQQEITKLRDDLAWDAAESEVKAQKESLEQQISSLEEYVEYVEEYYDELFKHPEELIAEMEDILARTDEEIISWLQANNEEFVSATAASQESMRVSWQETLDQMRGTIRTHWDEVASIIAQGDDAIIAFLMENSQKYKEASAKQAEAYVEEWKDKLKDLLAAYKDTYEQIQSYSYVPVRVSTYSSSSSNPSSSSSPGGSPGGGGINSNNIKSSLSYDKNDQPVYTYTYNGKRVVKDPKTGDWKYYAKGGLVDFTGPAWVDGTKSAPEAFLNAKQTALIGDFAKMLEKVYLNIPSMPAIDYDGTGGGSNISVGDIIVNVDSLSSDEDYEDMAARVMDTIADELTRNAVVGGIRRTK